ncbi:MAG: cytochrome c biogenesis protein CcsA [Burkholderiales bacterium]|jgi:ABC-type uncharacterized transport system permease subunit|nr:cytochrome c biogenesis protein CcsA [Burkholderiales bacterium]
MSILLYGLAFALYALLGAHLFRTRWRAQPQGAAAALAAWERAAILVPLALHSWLLYQDLLGGPSLRFGFSQALSLMMWLAVLFYWIESLFYSLQGIFAIVLPVAAVTVVLPALFPGFEAPPYTGTAEFRLHLLLAMLAYSLFAMAALQAALMLALERKLHRGDLRGPVAGLPPLLTLEALLFRILGLGFLFLTLTLLAGAAFSEELFGRALPFNHKTLFGLISWLIFGALLAGRHFYGWRGRKALHWTLAGFAVLLLAYVGSRFVLEVVLGRSLA